MNAITISREFRVNPHVTSLIDGESVKAKAGGEDFPVVNPTTEVEISRLREVIPSLPIPAAQYESIINTCRALEKSDRADALVKLTVKQG